MYLRNVCCQNESHSCKWEWVKYILSSCLYCLPSWAVSDSAWREFSGNSNAPPWPTVCPFHLRTGALRPENSHSLNEIRSQNIHGSSSLTMKLWACSVESSETQKYSHHLSHCRFASQILRYKMHTSKENKKRHIHCRDRVWYFSSFLFFLVLVLR